MKIIRKICEKNIFTKMINNLIERKEKIRLEKLLSYCDYKDYQLTEKVILVANKTKLMDDRGLIYLYNGSFTSPKHKNKRGFFFFHIDGWTGFSQLNKDEVLKLNVIE